MKVGLTIEEDDMENPLVLKLCVADPPYGADVDAVYNAIEKNLEGAEIYRLDKSKVTAAAIEMIVILGAAASIATIAGFLYQIWKDHKDKGSLYVAADPKNGIQQMISDEISDKEIEEFQTKLTKLIKSDRSGQIYEKTILEVRYSKAWVKTK